MFLMIFVFVYLVTSEMVTGGGLGFLTPCYVISLIASIFAFVYYLVTMGRKYEKKVRAFVER